MTEPPQRGFQIIDATSDTPKPREADPLDVIREALIDLNFGEIVIGVHDGEIVQIARTEKTRPPKRR